MLALDARICMLWSRFTRTLFVELLRSHNMCGVAFVWSRFLLALRRLASLAQLADSLFVGVVFVART